MNENSEIAIKDIKEGDVYYILINKKYFFLQVVKIVTGLNTPYDKNEYKYGFFIVFFQKTFTSIPKIGELDLQNIRVNRYWCKNEACYFSIWEDEPYIKFKKHLMYYDHKDKYKFIKFTNIKVPNFNNFKPPLIPQFSLPAEYKLFNGICNSHHPYSIQAVIGNIIREEESRNKKSKIIEPKYFIDWLEYIDTPIIERTEKAIFKFEEKTGRSKTIENSLKQCVERINKLDEKYSYIGTIEREDIFETLLEIAKNKEIEENKAFKLIDVNRNW